MPQQRSSSAFAPGAPRRARSAGDRSALGRRSGRPSEVWPSGSSCGRGVARAVHVCNGVMSTMEHGGLRSNTSGTAHPCRLPRPDVRRPIADRRPPRPSGSAAVMPMRCRFAWRLSHKSRASGPRETAMGRRCSRRSKPALDWDASSITAQISDSPPTAQKACAFPGIYASMERRSTQPCCRPFEPARNGQHRAVSRIPRSRLG
jgi:hypothetical protein